MNRTNQRHVRSAFTLIAILIVIAIVVILFAGSSRLVTNSFKSTNSSKRSSKEKITEKELIADIKKTVASEGNMDVGQNQYTAERVIKY